MDQLRAEYRKRHDITVDSLTQMLMEEREIAHKAKRPAVDAVMGIAKLHGYIVDKSKADHTTDGKPIQPVINVTVGAAQEAQEFTDSIIRCAQRMREGDAPKEPS